MSALEGLVSREVPGHQLLVIKFGYEGCGPCAKYDKAKEVLAEEFAERVKFVTIDVRANDVSPEDREVRLEVKRSGRVSSVPAIFMFDAKGVEVSLQQGFSNVAELRTEIDRVLGQSRLV